MASAEAPRTRTISANPAERTCTPAVGQSTTIALTPLSPVVGSACVADGRPLAGATVAFGQAGTLTATVTQSMPNRPAPTGTVSFYDGTTLLGSAALSSGSADLATSALAVGSHSITAVYSGSADYAGSGGEISQVISP